jgi:hypothetical protein
MRTLVQELGWHSLTHEEVLVNFCTFFPPSLSSSSLFLTLSPFSLSYSTSSWCSRAQVAKFCVSDPPVEGLGGRHVALAAFLDLMARKHTNEVPAFISYLDLTT